MKVTYIYHSGIVVETDECVILIDYYRDADIHYVRNLLQTCNKPFYILSSHAHPDHFNPEIIGWKKKRKNITYLLSEDIPEARLAKPGGAYSLKKGNVYKDSLIRVKAFGSTDTGISFLIETGGKKIFHAGDLNNWHWMDESTPEEAADAEQFYLEELGDLATKAPQIDVTAFPVDPRLGADYMRGAKQFINRIQTSYFLPIHFGDAYAKANAFREYAKKHNVHFWAITHQGESFNL